MMRSTAPFPPSMEISAIASTASLSDGSFLRVSAPFLSIPPLQLSTSFNPSPHNFSHTKPLNKIVCQYDDDGQTFRPRPRSYEQRMRSGPYGRDPYSKREAYGIPSDADIAETIARLDLAPERMLQPGDPGTYQVRIRDVMPVGYFVDMPNGREGYLPASDFGFTGGLFVLRKMFQVGHEVTVRITERGGGGREILSMHKPDPNAPPPQRKIIGGSSSDNQRPYGRDGPRRYGRGGRNYS